MWPAELVATAAVAVGMVVTLVAVRVWLPSVLFIYGRAGSTPAADLAVFGLLPFVVALLVAATTIRVDVSRAAAPLAFALVAARLALQSTSGGTPQLVVATVAVTVGMVWLVVVATGAVPPRAAALGLVAGLALDAVLHAALRSQDLPWRDGAAAWFATLAVAATFAAASWATRGPQAGDRGQALPWISLGPAVGLLAIVAAVSRVETVTGVSPVVAVAVVGTAHVIGVVAAVAALGAPSRRAPGAGGVLVAVGLSAAVLAPMHVQTPPVRVAGTVALVVGVHLLLAVVGWPDGSGPSRRALGAAGGLFVLFVVVSGYYASYDVRFPFDRRALMVVAAVAAIAPPALARPASATARCRHAGVAVAVGVAGMTAAAVAAVAVRTPPGHPAPGRGFPVRVMTYNLHMGFDIAGRYDPDALAAVIGEEQPDIVALQEVDRGWFTTGSTDVLRALTERLQLPYVFAPAADDVWGNAVLSRYPMLDPQVVPLPRGRAAMARSALSVVVDVAGQPLGVVATHLHHVDADVGLRRRQVARVAALASDLAQQVGPVVVLGDLNAEPGAGELEPLATRFVDASVALGAPATYPSWRPRESIDHVFVSSELFIGRLSVPASPASDHLPVALTVGLRPLEAGGGG